MEQIGKLLNQNQICSQRYSDTCLIISPAAKQKALQVAERYGEFENFCSVFSIAKCESYVTNCKDRMFVGDAPTLTIMRATYGDKATITWIELFLAYIVKSNGLYEKTDITQLDSVANNILSHYGYLKATEFMLFFSMFNSSMFRNDRGEDATRMYGEFQGSAIMDCLYKFNKYRNSELDRIERECKPKIDYTNSITYEEFLKLKQNLK